MKAAALSFQSVSRSYGTNVVLQDINFEVLTGEFVAIVGPSGCGKTTLLNMASGYDRPSSGKIEYEGQIRMVYQQDGLFPWRTVKENIELGLRDIHDEKTRAQQVQGLLHLIQLESFEAYYPHQLSGGMRQRVELARALAGRSDILLLDEPFSALDYLTRMRMRRELARILHERPRTVLLVTHDIEEAAQLADRIFVLSTRPAQISFELSICLPRPRDLTHPEVVAATERILRELGLENEPEELLMPEEIRKR
jgi:NitT/TauT family transport system ATP-binding protein